ncbi:MAG: J domain-containing protein [Nitrospirota bacterium]
MALIVSGLLAAFLIGRLVRLVLLRLNIIKGGTRTITNAINDIVLTYLITFGVILLITRWQARLFIPGIAVMILYDIARLKLSALNPRRHDYQDSGCNQPSAEADDPYTILGVHRNDSIDKIKRVYLKLQEAYHPDKHAADSTEASMEQKNKKIKQINAAYEWILKNHGT